jgi:DNA-binding response OmpR family regulator
LGCIINTKMRFLIVSDASKSYLPLKRFLEEEAFAVDYVSDPSKGAYLAKVNGYDVIIIGHMRDNHDGVRLCFELRESGCELPIVGLAFGRELNDRLEFLSAGADDSFPKPYSFQELLARIRAIIRRGPTLKADILEAAGVILNCHTQEVRSSGRRISLSRKEYALLELLMRNKGGIVSRSVILEHVWDMNHDPFSNTVEAHVFCLRKKLGSRARRAIRNVQGRGYLIEP